MYSFSWNRLGLTAPMVRPRSAANLRMPGQSSSCPRDVDRHGRRHAGELVHLGGVLELLLQRNCGRGCSNTLKRVPESA